METVIPKDIPLGLPAPFWLLEFLLLLSFTLHILFVNLMVGGSIMVVATEILSFRNRDWDRISREIAKTITVNKSLAVVLGVGPLLTISVLYTTTFYSANLLTGHVWILIVPLVISAFLLTYAHRYWWDKLAETKGLRLAIALAALGLFLFIPLIFLTNINLMLYPERWRDIASFWDALMLANVLPRYLHFLAATVAVLGLFLAKWFGRDGYVASLELESTTCNHIVRRFYALALGATALQFVSGPLVVFTLPGHVVSISLILMLVFAVLPLAALAILWLWQEVQDPQPGGRFWRIVGALTVAVVSMVYARHDVRETALAPHRELVAAKTTAYLAKVQGAQSSVVIPGGPGGEPLGPGAQLYQQRCTICHALDKRLVGPPLVEMASQYMGNPEGIVAWVLEPGRKGKDYPAMPPQRLPREDLLKIAKHMLAVALP